MVVHEMAECEQKASVTSLKCLKDERCGCLQGQAKDVSELHYGKSRMLIPLLFSF